MPHSGDICELKSILITLVMASSMEITNYDHCLLGIRRKGANPMPPLFSSDVVVAIATFLKLPHPHVLYNTYWAKMSLSSSNQWIILLYKCRERLKSWANVCCLTWAGHVREQDLRPVGKWQSLPKLAQTWVFTAASSVCSNAGNCSFLLLTASYCCLGTSYQDYLTPHH